MKIVDFSETIEACDLKVGRYRQKKLIDFMKVCEYLRSRSFLDLGPYKNLNQIFSETTGPF